MPFTQDGGRKYILESDLLDHYRAKILAKRGTQFQKRV
jgi:hypothetical protein